MREREVYWRVTFWKELKLFGEKDSWFEDLH